MPATQRWNEASTIDSNRAMWWGVGFSFAFTLLIWLVRPWMPQIDFLPDQGVQWYYWKLPDPDFWSRASGWGGYLLHQVTIWALIYHAQKSKPGYTKKLHGFNVLALGATAFFCVLHLGQTWVWYDGLGQDLGTATSQGAVILMLVLILLMENQRRGLFFGKKIKFLNRPGAIIRHYHGYIFSWAVIYTFWYHPMEATFGHLVGFLYTFLLLVQSSLFFTRAHVNKYWMFVQEAAVLIHGSLVAYEQQVRGGFDKPFWLMFFWGFAALIVVTQMYGLGLSPKVRWSIIALFVAGVVFSYADRPIDANEIIRIPVIEYGLVFILALFIYLGIWINKGVKRLRGAGA
ncbi:MAG: hypothetical protein AAF564_07485 [Bacteroidota bacterium]